MSESMAAIQQDSFGPPEVMRLVEVERPAPRATEVLVRVHASGVNPVDWKTRAGHGVLRTLPLTVGWDISGVVAAVGPGVTLYQPGDEVFGMPRFPGEAGGYAEFVTARARQLASKPAGLSHAEAAGLPLAGLTAWQVLVETAQISPGQRVLITAAGGGVGHLAVQIAKARGAHVTALASPATHPTLRELGADAVIDYRSGSVHTAVAGLDLVFDSFGGPDTRRWLPALRPGGLLVPLTGAPDTLAAEAAAHGVRARRFLVEPDRQGLGSIAGLVEAGALRVLLAAELPLAEAAAAHRQGEAGHQLGKIVLTP